MFRCMFELFSSCTKITWNREITANELIIKSIYKLSDRSPSQFAMEATTYFDGGILELEYLLSCQEMSEAEKFKQHDIIVVGCITLTMAVESLKYGEFHLPVNHPDTRHLYNDGDRDQFNSVVSIGRSSKGFHVCGEIIFFGELVLIHKTLPLFPPVKLFSDCGLIMEAMLSKKAFELEDKLALPHVRLKY